MRQNILINNNICGNACNYFRIYRHKFSNVMLEFLCKQIIIYNIMFHYECYISCYTGTVSFTKFGDQMNCLEQREHSKIFHQNYNV